MDSLDALLADLQSTATRIQTRQQGPVVAGSIGPEKDNAWGHTANGETWSTGEVSPWNECAAFPTNGTYAYADTSSPRAEQVQAVTGNSRPLEYHGNVQNGGSERPYVKLMGAPLPQRRAHQLPQLAHVDGQTLVFSGSGGDAAFTATGGRDSWASLSSSSSSTGNGRSVPIGGSRDSLGVAPPPLPPPLAQDVIESFHRDLEAESFYEPQNLKCQATFASPMALPMQPNGSTNCESQPSSRQPSVRRQQQQQADATVVRTSLAHNLGELDMLLQELGASPYSTDSAPVGAFNNSGGFFNGYNTGLSKAKPPANVIIQPSQQHTPYRSIQQSTSTPIESRANAGPRSPTSSSATKELDELMASLSQFKVNASFTEEPRADEYPYAQLPNSSGAYGAPTESAAKQQQTHQLQQSPKPLQPRDIGESRKQSLVSTAVSQLPSPPEIVRRNDLDHMLGYLETDLTRQGASVVTKGHCAACNNQIVGQVVTALGRLWHTEHFCCRQCEQELATVSFFERDGIPYCERDYHELFAPKCACCGDAVINKCVTALGATWHPQCFSCSACGRQLADEGFHEKDGGVYCRDDFFELFAPRCGGCSAPIYENFVSALSRHWHPACFVCMDCGVGFVGSSFFDHAGLPYCETHYHFRKGSLCAGCQKPVAGRCVTAMMKKFHPEHFVCAFCLKQLNKGTFKEQNDKPYCHGCFVRLFS